MRLFLSVFAAENLIASQETRCYCCFFTGRLRGENLHEDAAWLFFHHREDAIMELRRAVYGLKQASASFYNAMDSHLKSKGFVPTLGDPCLYRRVNTNGSVIIVCLYVDDALFGVADQASADSFLAELRERFEISQGEGEPADFVLGKAIKQDLSKGIIHLSMELAITKLVGSILTLEGIVKSSSVDTPMHACGSRKQTERTVSKEDFDYLSVVGSLLHIANCVRCDIAHAVGVLCRHALCPGQSHVRAAKRALMHLYTTGQLGINYRRDNSTRNVPRMFEGDRHPLDNGRNLLQTFADSDYAENHAVVWFRDHFRAVDTMLWAARLLPCLWPEEIWYSCFVFIRTPLDSLGGVSPLQLLNGLKPRWDHFKVWGCTAYEHIPNDKLGKVPGLPRGRKLIFVGFDSNASSYKLFDPETRRFLTSVNVGFYEDFSEHIDSLRHHGRRRDFL
jgi:hypothetical protein